MGERPLAGAPWLEAAPTATVLDALAQGGQESRFVGGCVRDALLAPDADAPDLDIATREPPERVMALLGEAGLRVIPTGLAHGTVTAHCGGRSYEITTLRRDVSTDGRHATVAFSTDFREDAGRRDFTFNALYADRAGRITDFFAGWRDLAEGRVRFIGDPRHRIAEDYLRILRFFRFYARYGRTEPDTATLAAIRAALPGLDRLAADRIRNELMKLLVAPDATRSLRLMQDCGVDAALFGQRLDPALFARLVERQDPLVGLAALVRASGLPSERLGQRLNLSNHDLARLQRLAGMPLPSGVDRREGLLNLLEEHPLEDAEGLVILAAATSGDDASTLLARLGLMRSLSPPTFPLSGRDLLERGVAAGPEFGELLRRLRLWWRERGYEPDRTACLAELERQIRHAHLP